MPVIATEWQCRMKATDVFSLRYLGKWTAPRHLDKLGGIEAVLVGLRVM